MFYKNHPTRKIHTSTSLSPSCQPYSDFPVQNQTMTDYGGHLKMCYIFTFFLKPLKTLGTVTCVFKI